MLRLTCGRSQLGLANVVVKRTTSPATGVSTSFHMRTTAPVLSTASNRVVRSPTLPGANQQVASLEREPAVVGKGRPYRGERGSQLVVFDEHLKCMTDHDDQVELLIPTDRAKVTEDPLDVRPLTRLLEHPAGGVESDQPPGVTCLAGSVQQRTRPAADVEHRLRRHHQWQVEAEVASSLPRMEHVIQLSEAGIGEQAIDHHTSLSGPPSATANGSFGDHRVAFDDPWGNQWLVSTRQA